MPIKTARPAIRWGVLRFSNRHMSAPARSGFEIFQLLRYAGIVASMEISHEYKIFHRRHCRPDIRKYGIRLLSAQPANSILWCRHGLERRDAELYQTGLGLGSVHSDVTAGSGNCDPALMLTWLV
ncbi:MAG: hypothetical protein HRU33_11455 [Rhodobacteraceae bacterium]|nr:hypothetical protein [Paracoccaceae bacterium]